MIIHRLILTSNLVVQCKDFLTDRITFVIDYHIHKLCFISVDSGERIRAIKTLLF